MPSAPRQFLLRLEDALQAGAHLGRRTWATLRYGRRPFRAADFRGGRCHCAAGTPHFVHSEGLREACDFVVDYGTNVRSAHRPPVPPARLAAAVAELGPGTSVHVKADLLDDFVAHLLPALRQPVVLVSGDSDAGLVDRHRALLGDARIAHWFAQNCDLPGRHPRLTRIPIGLDNPVYSKLEKRLGFALTMLLGRTPFDPTIRRNDIGDQAALRTVRAGLPPPATRPVRALCTFHQNQKLVAPDLANLPARAQAWHELRDRDCCHFVDRRLRQRVCWERHGDFAFEVSPRGNGLDCFRTWEALLLGTIPIVRTSTLDPLYEDEALPVVIVQAWTEITAENLARWRAALQPRLGPEVEARLGLDHWVAKIRKASQSAAAR